MCVARSGEIQVAVDNVDSQDMSARKEFGKPRSDLASTASGIKYPRGRWERITLNQRDFLRPDGPRLGIQVPYHRLVGHLFSLRVEVDQCALLVNGN